MWLISGPYYREYWRFHLKYQIHGHIHYNLIILMYKATMNLIPFKFGIVHVATMMFVAHQYTPTIAESVLCICILKQMTLPRCPVFLLTSLHFGYLNMLSYWNTRPRRRRSWYRPKLLPELEYKQIHAKQKSTIINALTNSLDATEHLIDIHIIRTIADFAIGIIVNCCNTKYGCNNTIMFHSLQEMDLNIKENYEANPRPRYVPYWQRHQNHWGSRRDDETKENDDKPTKKIPIYQYIAKIDTTNTVLINNINRRIFCRECTKSKFLTKCNQRQCQRKDVERFCSNHSEVSTCDVCHERYISRSSNGNRCDYCYQYLSSWICRGCVRSAAKDENDANWNYLLSINWRKKYKKIKNNHCSKCKEYICALCNLCDCGTSYGPYEDWEGGQCNTMYDDGLPASLCIKLRVWHWSGCPCCYWGFLYSIYSDYGYDDDRFKDYKRAKNYRKWPINALKQNKWNLKGYHMKKEKLSIHLQRVQDKKACNLRKKEKYNNRSCAYNC